MAKKPTRKKPTQKPSTDFSFEIETEEPTVSFILSGEKIESTVAHFHKMFVIAQGKAFEAHGGTDFMPEYADELNKAFDIEFVITKEVAYRIYDYVINLFHDVKKNTTD